ncbi:MAG TPA: hypothetical protein VGN00_14055 [Puia sp.]
MNQAQSHYVGVQTLSTRRLQQYADRSGLSVQQVKVLLSYPSSHRCYRMISGALRDSQTNDPSVTHHQIHKN